MVLEECTGLPVQAGKTKIKVGECNTLIKMKEGLGADTAPKTGDKSI
ncbi:MAG: hypothetical protein GX660_10495 [Clostridiaceae bacterium]|nr:hypothetical protein [Clostridiaceae bacterium]